MTIEELHKDLTATLSPILGDSEAKSAARIILEDIRGITPTDIVVNGYRTVEPETVERIKEITNRICAGEPVQYAVGCARFYGMDFKVTPAVLIPRPETEGLVDMIVRDYGNHNDLRILDCGTGSGCIAIALARNLPFAAVEAIDISEDALKVAAENASALKTKVRFDQTDILKLNNLSAPDYHYSIIVSNPPYIADSERKDMDSRVTDYEPALALFVRNENPIVFYTAISKFAAKVLSPNGALYFEINPLFVSQLKTMFAEVGFDNVEITRDYLGRYRYAKATSTGHD